MPRTYFVLWYRLDGEDRYLIWFSGDRDGVLLDSNATIPSFPDRQSLDAFAHRHHIPIQPEEPLVHDLDALVEWLGEGTPDSVDCALGLAIWNVFIDVQATVENRDILRETPEHDSIYQKLFWGNNFPSLTPPGKHYVPTWTDAEIDQLRGVLNQGLRLFRKQVTLTTPQHV